MFRQVKLSLHNTYMFLKNVMLYLAKHNNNILRNIFNQASANVIFFVDFFVMLPQNRQFKTYKYQGKFIYELKDKIMHKKNVLVEKSAGMGATTCCVALFLWMWLFRKKTNLLIFTPVKSKLYRKKDDNGAFNLLLYMLEKLPNFLKPQNGYKITINKEKMYYICLENKDNNNKIYGVSAGHKRDLLNNLHLPDKYFRAALLDDFAFHKNADHHWVQLERLCESRVVVSTPNGSSNLFAELIKLEYAQIYTLHWMLHPNRDTAWYHQICQNLDPLEIEQNVNISYDYRFARKRKKVAASTTGNSDTATTKPRRKYARKEVPVSVLTGKKRSPHKNLPPREIPKEPSLQPEKPESLPGFLIPSLISSKWQKINLKPDEKETINMETAIMAACIINFNSKIEIRQLEAFRINNEDFCRFWISRKNNQN